jgi:hypothetical protein
MGGSSTTARPHLPKLSQRDHKAAVQGDEFKAVSGAAAGQARRTVERGGADRAPLQRCGVEPPRVVEAPSVRAAAADDPNLACLNHHRVPDPRARRANGGADLPPGGRWVSQIQRQQLAAQGARLIAAAVLERGGAEDCRRGARVRGSPLRQA